LEEVMPDKARGGLCMMWVVLDAIRLRCNSLKIVLETEELPWPAPPRLLVPRLLPRRLVRLDELLPRLGRLTPPKPWS
jgi:hypothetical protein